MILRNLYCCLGRENESNNPRYTFNLHPKTFGFISFSHLHMNFFVHYSDTCIHSNPAPAQGSSSWLPSYKICYTHLPVTRNNCAFWFMPPSTIYVNTWGVISKRNFFTSKAFYMTCWANFSKKSLLLGIITPLCLDTSRRKFFHPRVCGTYYCQNGKTIFALTSP